MLRGTADIARTITSAAARMALPLLVFAMPADGVSAAPDIRTSAANVVPACVTPDRLMRYLADRNPAVDAKYRDIAALYKQHGTALRVRWDYAFFQMLLETNSLKFGGDVKAAQNNFAGLGATGGGVRGDSYPSVSIGVLAQLQHLVVYSGERVDNPVGTRTREKQDDIIKVSQKLNRPVRFSDLTNRWAADRQYMRSIETLARNFRDAHCKGGEVTAAAQPAPASAVTPAVPPAAKRSDGQRMVAAGLISPPAAKPATKCEVWTASYGGQAAVLLRSPPSANTVTVLRVPIGDEQRHAEAYLASHLAGGAVVGVFPSHEAAVSRALELCPST